MTKTSYFVSLIVHLGVVACFVVPALVGGDQKVVSHDVTVDAAVQSASVVKDTNADAEEQNIQYAAVRAPAAMEKPSSVNPQTPQETAKHLSTDQNAVRIESPPAETRSAASSAASQAQAVAASDIQTDDGRQNLGARITNLDPKTVAALLSNGQAIIVVRFASSPMYIFNGREAALWPDDGLPQFSQRQYGLVGEDRDAALRALQSKFGYGETALAGAEVRLVVRGQIDSLILGRQIASIQSAKLTQPDVLRTIGNLVLGDGGTVTDYRVRSLVLKNKTLSKFLNETGDTLCFVESLASFLALFLSPCHCSVARCCCSRRFKMCRPLPSAVSSSSSASRVTPSPATRSSS